MTSQQGRAETFLQAGLNSNKPLASEIQSIPCRIDYTGPANISDYFHRELIGEENSNEESATFRGRLLNGHKFQLPDGFKLCVAKEQRNSGGEKRVFQIEGISDHFALWEYDRQPSTKNPKQRALNYLRIAQDLAKDD